MDHKYGPVSPSAVSPRGQPVLEGQQEEKQEAVRGGGEHLGLLQRGAAVDAGFAVVEQESALGKH